MAVYTQVSAEAVTEFLEGFGAAPLTSFKGIAEGVENSNYLVETTDTKYILTLYESRVDPDDLPFFLALLDHLHGKGLPVPRFIADRDGKQIHELAGRPACLIEFLSGVSTGSPTPQEAAEVGAILGTMHVALSDFSVERTNSMGIESWRPLRAKIPDAELETITKGLATRIDHELDFLEANWPSQLPRSAIHADLFPDNVLMLDHKVSGLIDFYFAATDIRAYDLAVTHAAWCFDGDGSAFDQAISQALLNGYTGTHGLTTDEVRAMSLLARGASLRFLLTRAYDWVNTPADAMVTRKDPLAFLRRLDFYAEHGATLFEAAAN